MNRISFLFPTLSVVLSLSLNAGVEDSLALYASFDRGVEPEIARGGFRLAAPVTLPKAEGRFGGAVRVAKADKPDDLVYLPPAGFGTNGWTLALWLSMDERYDAHYGDRSFSRGVFSSNGASPNAGGIGVSFTCWVEFLLDQHPVRPGGSTRTMLPSKAFDVRRWTHVAFTFRPDGTNAIYIDGSPASYSEHSAAARLEAVRKLRIGSCRGNGDSLDGAIDELKVYGKALTADEVREAMQSLPLRRTADVALYLPCDGEVTGRGYSSFSAVDLVFAPGKSREGAKVVRHGYDRRAILSVSGVAVRPVQSLFAYFAPDWPAQEGKDVRHGLLAASAGPSFSYELAQEGRELAFRVTSGGVTSRVALQDPPLKNGAFSRIAAGYDFTKGRLFVEADGIRREGRLKGATPSVGVTATVTVGDVLGADYYSKTQAEGTLDEILVANEWLDAATLAEVVETEIAKKPKATALSTVPSPVTEREAAAWDLAGAERVRTAARERVTLNALWRFQLVGEKRPFDAHDWIYLPVPGRYSGHENGASDAEFQLRDREMRPVKDHVYAGRPTYAYAQGWFERGFRAAPAWRGKSVTLLVDELSPTQSGDVLLNGQPLGKMPAGSRFRSFEIPEHRLRFGDGEWNFLTIRAVDGGNRWSWRGVRGDVALVVTDRVRGEAPEVVTSVREGKIRTGLRLVNRSSGEETLTVEARVEGTNAPAPFASAPVRVKPGETKTVWAEAPWTDAALWDIDSPTLYACALTVRDAAGRVRDELEPVRFGFRELEVRGREFFLNGKKIHLFVNDAWPNPTDPNETRRTAALTKAVGFNAVRMDFGGANAREDTVLDACDEAGILYFPNMVGVSGGTYARWGDPAARAELSEAMRLRAERWRNHACAVMWYTSINFLGYSWDYHPLKVADGYTYPGKRERARVCEEGIDRLRAHDASARPWFFQAGGNFGMVGTSNAYFCWWPQTEREAWPAEWAKRGTKPLIPIETSFPYFQSFFGMDLENPGVKPLFYFENLARYYGPAAYALDDPDMRTETRKSAQGRETSVWYDAPGLQKLKSDLLYDTITRWRGFGLSGFCPFGEIHFAFGRHYPRHATHTARRESLPARDFRRFGWTPDVRRWPYHADLNPELPLPTRDALAAAMAPELAFFDGGAEEPVDRQACYRGGERLAKRLVLVNDRRHAVTFVGAWSLGAETNAFSRTVGPGEVAAVEITRDLPAVDATRRLTLAATVRGTEALAVRPVAIAVRPSPSGRGLPTVSLYDAKGLTAARLTALGVPFRRVKGAGDVRDGVLVVGAESLDAGFAAVAKAAGLARRVGEGRVTPLVLAQRPEALAGLGLRTTPVYARTAFDAKGRAVSHWAGKGTLAPEKPDPDPATEKGMPKVFFHWNSQNIVSSYPILRPSEGAFEAWLTCGKDLVYAPVLAAPSGRGRILFCQAEIESRSRPDVQADALLVTLLRQAAADAARPAAESAVATVATAEQAAAWGVATNAVEADALAVAPAGKRAFAAFSARDLFFRRPVKMTAFSGEGVAPLLEPAVVAKKVVDGKTVYLVGVEAADDAANAAAAAKPGSSVAWAEEILQNRLRQIRSRVEREAGAASPNALAERMETPLTGGADANRTAWPYGHSRSIYETERHVRW